MIPLNEAPALQAPKAGNAFVSFEALPEDGPQVFTLVASNFIKDHVQTKPDGTTSTFDAVELYFGTVIDGKPYFVKEWPKKFSGHEKSAYGKVVKALTGELPEPGSRPADYYGKAVLITIENEDKISKKSGKQYRVSKIKGYSPVPKAMQKMAAPLAILKDALTAKLAESGNGNGAQDNYPDDTPF